MNFWTISKRVHARTNYLSSPCNFTVLHRPESVGMNSSWYIFLSSGYLATVGRRCFAQATARDTFPPHYLFLLTLVRECATKARVISRLRQRRLRLPPRPPLSFHPPLSESVSLARVFPLLLPLLPLIYLLGSFFERQPPSVLISGSSSRCPSYFAGWGRGGGVTWHSRSENKM